MGHTFFLEDGVETGNIIEGNLGMLTRYEADSVIDHVVYIDLNVSMPPFMRDRVLNCRFIGPSRVSVNELRSIDWNYCQNP